MLQPSDFPASMKADLETSFLEGREAFTERDYQAMIEVVPTTSDSKMQVFYGNLPRLQRLRAERQPRKFNEYKQVHTLDEWELTTTVNRKVLDDDKSGGALRARLTNFGNTVERSLKQETEEFIRDGVSITSFDKTSFFAPSHVYMTSSGATLGPVQANVNWGGSQLDSTTLQIREQGFAELRGDDSEILGMKLTHVAVKRGSPNDKAAKELSNSQFTVEANTMKDNVFKGSFDIIRFDYGLGASEWMALDLSRGDMKPINILSHSVAPGWSNLEYTQLLEDSHDGFWRNEFAFGVYGRFDWNPGDWRTAYLHGSSTYSVSGDLERARVLKPNA